MTLQLEPKEKYASDAALERLWTHSIGITNKALARTGKDPITGLPAIEEEAPGSGFAGKWREHRFVLTAAHVVQKATMADLSFFARPTGTLIRASEVSIKDAFSAVSLFCEGATIYRNELEDLAVIEANFEPLGPYLEFADIYSSWVDPKEDDTVVAVGYPSSVGSIHEQRSGKVIQKSILLSPTAFQGEALPVATGKNFNAFRQESHYLIPFQPASSGKHPGGISGAAAWVESTQQQVVWAPKFDFAGIFTHCYRNGSIVQIVNASVVRHFLTELFGG